MAESSGNLKTKMSIDASRNTSFTSQTPCRWVLFYLRFNEVMLMS